MARRAARPGVFCLEGNWSPRLTDGGSVKPILEVLEKRGSIRGFVHRDAATEEELAFYLNEWRQAQYRGYTVGFFAFHGSVGGIQIGRRHVSLERFLELLKGRCRGKILYFGSCATLEMPPKKLDAFRARTGARAVCGYTQQVDWIESAAFEMLLIDALASYKRIDAPFRMLKKNHGDLWKRLGMVYATGPS